MNLHGIASAAIAAVNPMVLISVEVSTGSTTLDDGTRVPAFAKPVVVSAQIQPLTGGDLRQVEGLNLQGEFQGIYINGHIDGLVRSENKGGDRITLVESGNVYLVTMVLENWPDWTKVVATLQNGA